MESLRRRAAALRAELAEVEKCLGQVRRDTDRFASQASEISASIHLGIHAEEDWDGPSIKPGTLTDEQVAWLGGWLASEGWSR